MGGKKRNVSISETLVINVCGLTIGSIKKEPFSRPDEFLTVYAMRSQNMMTSATNRKRRDRNCSSMYCGVPGAAAKIEENKLWCKLYRVFFFLPSCLHGIKHQVSCCCREINNNRLVWVTVTTHPEADYFSITARHGVFYCSYTTAICWCLHVFLFLLMNDMDFISI